eukprot:1159435-Pelagomonas_calceolata.AAC.2
MASTFNVTLSKPPLNATSRSLVCVYNQKLECLHSTYAPRTRSLNKRIVDFRHFTRLWERFVEVNCSVIEAKKMHSDKDGRVRASVSEEYPAA